MKDKYCNWLAVVLGVLAIVLLCCLVQGVPNGY